MSSVTILRLGIAVAIFVALPSVSLAYETDVARVADSLRQLGYTVEASALEQGNPVKDKNGGITLQVSKGALSKGEHTFIPNGKQLTHNNPNFRESIYPLLMGKGSISRAVPTKSGGKTIYVLRSIKRGPGGTSITQGGHLGSGRWIGAVRYGMAVTKEKIRRVIRGR